MHYGGTMGAREPGNGAPSPPNACWRYIKLHSRIARRPRFRPAFRDRSSRDSRWWAGRMLLFGRKTGPCGVEGGNGEKLVLLVEKGNGTLVELSWSLECDSYALWDAAPIVQQRLSPTCSHITGHDCPAPHDVCRFHVSAV